MKRRWVLASVHNVCAAGDKPFTISVSVNSFMWIFLVIITGEMLLYPDQKMMLIKLYVTGGLFHPCEIE